ncbi:hypothetical protein JRY02_20730 [Enterobacter roggenkampii]|nr:hypothetical protein [Enterobacter roggenkampii]
MKEILRLRGIIMKAMNSMTCDLLNVRANENTFLINNLKDMDLNSATFFIGCMECKTLYNSSIAMNCSPVFVMLNDKKFRMYFFKTLFICEGRKLITTDFFITLDKELNMLFSKNILIIEKSEI